MRTIREEDAARRALDAAVEKWSRAIDAWEAATWAVARDPEAGDPVTESGRIRAYTFEGARSIDMPTITVLYETDLHCVIVHDALFTDAKYAQAGQG